MKPIFNIPNNNKTYLIYLSLVIVLGVLTFNNLVDLGLDAYDDRDHMVDTPAIVDDWTFMFSDQRLVEMRPPVDILFVMGYLMWGDDPAGYHFILVVLHICATIVLAWAFKEFGADLSTAGIAALFFFLNVAHHRAIHQITTVTFIFALICGLIVIVCFRRFLYQRKHFWLVLSVVFLITGVFTHPSIISVVLFCAYVAWQKEKTFKYVFYHVMPLGVTGMLLVYLAIIASLHGDQVNGVVRAPEFTELFVKPFWYLGRLWGSAHWISPTLFRGTLVNWEIFLGCAFVLLTLILYKKKIFPAADWAIWTCITVLPFMNYPLEMMELGPSRHLYIASAGSSFVLVWGIWQCVSRLSFSKQRAIFGVITIVLLFCSFHALKRVEAYSYYRSGRGYMAQSDIVPAEQQLTKAIKKDINLIPKDVFERLAIIRLSLGVPIRPIVEEALEAYPNFDELHLMQGVAYFQESNSLHVKAAQSHIQEAFELTENVNGLKLTMARLLQSLGGFYHQNNQYEQAIPFYQEALKLNPEYGLAYYNLGNALNASGQYTQAVDAYLRAIDLKSDLSVAVQNVANTLFENGDLDAALPLYKSLAEKMPISDHYYNLGIVYKKLGEFEAAEKAFISAQQLAPNDIDVLLRLAEVFHAQGATQKSIDMYQQVLDIQPNQVVALVKMGRAIYNQGEKKKGIYSLLNATELQPDFGEAWQVLGDLLYDIGDYQNALSAFQNAYDLQNQVADLPYSIGMCYEALSNMDQAVVWYRKALEIDPQHAQAKQRLGR